VVGQRRRHEHDVVLKSVPARTSDGAHRTHVDQGGGFSKTGLNGFPVVHGDVLGIHPGGEDPLFDRIIERRRRGERPRSCLDATVSPASRGAPGRRGVAHLNQGATAASSMAPRISGRTLPPPSSTPCRVRTTRLVPVAARRSFQSGSPIMLRRLHRSRCAKNPAA